MYSGVVHAGVPDVAGHGAPSACGLSPTQLFSGLPFPPTGGALPPGAEQYAAAAAAAQHHLATSAPLAGAHANVPLAVDYGAAAGALGGGLPAHLRLPYGLPSPADFQHLLGLRASPVAPHQALHDALQSLQGLSLIHI